MIVPTYLTIDMVDGTSRKIPLPPIPDLAEFALQGNWRQFTQFLACFDGTSNTAAIFYYGTQCWHLNYPADRELFWRQCQFLDSLTPSQEAAVAFAGTTPAHVTKH